MPLLLITISITSVFFIIGIKSGALYIEEELKEDYDFLQELLEKSVLVLPHLGSKTYTRFPSIMNIEIISKYFNTKEFDELSLIKAIPSQLWTDRIFVNGWFSCGGNMNDKMHKSFCDDKELILSYTKNYKRIDRWINSGFNYMSDGFNYMSNRLLIDKNFLARLIAVHVNPENIFRATSLTVKKDKDLLLIACSTHPNYNPKNNFYDKYYGYLGNESAREFENWVRLCMKEYEGFFKGVLCGATPNSNSPLVVFDQGHDLKRMIASFLIFLKGEKLTMLFKTAINLKIPGFFNPYECR